VRKEHKNVQSMKRSKPLDISRTTLCIGVCLLCLGLLCLGFRNGSQ